jgi:hypothetical protein
MIKIKSGLTICILFLLLSGVVGQAQFVDNFDKREIKEWLFFTGDGKATMDFLQQDNGFATVLVDATKDRITSGMLLL